MNDDQLIVTDNFTDDPGDIRREALRLNFNPTEWNGAVYHGVGLGYTPPLQRQIEQLIGGPIRINLAFFRAGTSTMRPTTDIHADIDCGQYAGVLYLNLPNQKFGGTGFWTHRELGWDEIPDGTVITKELADKLNSDGNDVSKWELNSIVGMKFNRFVTYPTRRFHSRYPNHVEAPDVENGRLIWAVMYDRL